MDKYCERCYARDAKPCMECSTCNPGHRNFRPAPTPPPTHGDRIRAMSDAEHARFLVRVVSDGCPPDMDWDCQKDEDGWDACDKCWERWLRQPAKDKEKPEH